MAALAALALIATCGTRGPAGSLSADASQGHLTVGIRFDQPGLGERTLNGEFKGFDVEVARLIRQDDRSIVGPESLNGKKLCTVVNTTSAQAVKDKFAHEVTLVEYPRYPDCKPFTNDAYGIGLRKGDPDGMAKVNAALQKMIAGGAWKAAALANLGASGYELPAPPAITAH